MLQLWQLKRNLDLMTNKTEILPTIAEDTEKEEYSVFQYKEGMLLLDLNESDPEIMYAVVVQNSSKENRFPFVWEINFGELNEIKSALEIGFELSVPVNWNLAVMTVLDLYLLGKSLPVKQSDGTWKYPSECDG